MYNITTRIWPTLDTVTIALMGICVYLLNGRNVVRRLKRQLFRLHLPISTDREQILCIYIVNTFSTKFNRDIPSCDIIVETLEIFCVYFARYLLDSHRCFPNDVL